MLKIIAFIIIAVVVIGGGMWYNQKLDNAVKQQAAADEAKAQEAVAAAQAAEAQQIADFQKNNVKDVRVGTGAEAQRGEFVTVNYEGKFTNGKVFDTSYGKHPFTFQLGGGQVIRGWDWGLLGMKVGGKRTLTIPPDLGYGSKDYGPIPASSTLLFSVELLDVTSTPPTAQ